MLDHIKTSTVFGYNIFAQQSLLGRKDQVDSAINATLMDGSPHLNG